MISKPPVASLFVTGWFVASVSVGQEAPKIDIPAAPEAAPEAASEVAPKVEAEEVKEVIEVEEERVESRVAPDLKAKVEGAVASVYRGVVEPNSAPAGMGFFVDDGGTFVSVFGVEPDVSEKITIGNGDDFQEARLLAHDPKTGLVLLRVGDASGDFLDLGASQVREDSKLFLEFASHQVSGESAPRRSRARYVGREISHQGQPFAVPLLHLKFEGTDYLPGTPIVDTQGRVSGIISCGAGGIDPGCFALPVDVLKKIQENFDQFGKIQAGWIGLIVDSQRNNPVVVELRDGSPARAAGVLPGDIVKRIGGRQIRDMKDMVDACYHLSPGESVEFVVLRGVEDVSLTMTPISAQSVGSSSVPPQEEEAVAAEDSSATNVASPDGGTVTELPSEEVSEEAIEEAVVIPPAPEN